MGSAMAHCLIKEGHRFTVYNRTLARADQLATDGGLVVDRPADVSHGDAVITMLADDHAVDHVTLGKDGILAALGENTTPFTCTISVALSERLALEHAQAHRDYVAAPVFGRPDAAAFHYRRRRGESCRALSDSVRRHATEDLRRRRKAACSQSHLSGNFLITSVIDSLGETFALTRKSGIDAHRFLEILTGALFSAPISKTYGGLIADEHYEPAGFKMTLGVIRLALAVADSLLVPMPLASLIHDRMLTVVARGEGDADWSALAIGRQRRSPFLN